MKRVVLVTGGTKGIGRAIAEGFAALGDCVAVNSEDPNDVDIAVEEMRQAGYNVIPAWADVSKADQVQAMVGKILEEAGQIDVLVNNAGTLTKHTILDMTEEEWDFILDTNLKSVFLVTRAVYPYMLERKYGRIINTSSVVAFRGALFGEVHYAASKAGIIGFTKTLARQAAPNGITVNAVAPGAIFTPMMQATLKGEQLENALALIPQGRMGKGEEVAAAVVFLASDGAAHITGATIDVNGGAYTR